jgi:ethanolamine utilization protein EutN
VNIARVVGSLVSTIKHPAYDRTKLLLVQPLDMEGADSGATMVAVDAIGAGSGELVLICKEGSAARQVLGLENPPVRSLVIGIIDEVQLADGSALRG